MQTKITPQYSNTSKGKVAQKIISNCVHCGFCSATCPTYLNTGNELNSPRGRIYLIKQLLEGDLLSQTSLEHLNLCLQCHNCETTCPSGVEYGKLYEIGQELLKETTPNSLSTRLKYFFFSQTLPYPKRFAIIFNLHRLAKPFLPKALANQFKTPRSNDPLLLNSTFKEHIILFKGCVQRILAPEINQSIENLLQKIQTSATHCDKENCCGAIDWHAGNKNAAYKKMKHNIDMWTELNQPLLISASGCSAFIKQYHEHLKDNSNYAKKAKILLKKTFDTVDYFTPEKLSQLKITPKKEKIACHTPCTLQHWQKNPNTLTNTLKAIGFNLVHTNNPHLCCGSAGLYSAMNPKLSNTIKINKVNDLTVSQPDRVVSNNIGCLNHLQSDLNVPIQHWCEVVDEWSE